MEIVVEEFLRGPVFVLDHRGLSGLVLAGALRLSVLNWRKGGFPIRVYYKARDAGMQTRPCGHA